MFRTIIITTLLSLSLVGCKDAVEETPTKAVQADLHAGADVVPGSHEDWCGEHAVPESQCTRCNDTLVPAFKATGDWCEKHNLPESQCLACNPDLKIVRPEKETKK